MGSLILPTSGEIYVDAQIIIYSVDKHPLYEPVCRPLWKAAQRGAITVVSSELVLMETLVGPLRDQDNPLRVRRERVWTRRNTQLLPVTRAVLLEAAYVRAINTAVKTPDAIHAATALLAGCALFVTNDLGFRRVPGLPLAILDDVLNAP